MLWWYGPVIVLNTRLVVKNREDGSPCCGVSMPIIGMEIALRSNAQQCTHWREMHLGGITYGNRIKIKIWSETPDSAFYIYEIALQWRAIGWNHMEMGLR